MVIILYSIVDERPSRAKILLMHLMSIVGDPMPRGTLLRGVTGGSTAHRALTAAEGSGQSLPVQRVSARGGRPEATGVWLNYDEQFLPIRGYQHDVWLGCITPGRDRPCSLKRGDVCSWDRVNKTTNNNAISIRWRCWWSSIDVGRRRPCGQVSTPPLPWLRGSIVCRLLRYPRGAGAERDRRLRKSLHRFAFGRPAHDQSSS